MRLIPPNELETRDIATLIYTLTETHNHLNDLLKDFENDADYFKTKAIITMMRTEIREVFDDLGFTLVSEIEGAINDLEKGMNENQG